MKTSIYYHSSAVFCFGVCVILLASIARQAHEILCPILDKKSQEMIPESNREAMLMAYLFKIVGYLIIIHAIRLAIQSGWSTVCCTEISLCIAFLAATPLFWTNKGQAPSTRINAKQGRLIWLRICCISTIPMLLLAEKMDQVKSPSSIHYIILGIFLSYEVFIFMKWTKKMWAEKFGIDLRTGHHLNVRPTISKRQN